MNDKAMIEGARLVGHTEACALVLSPDAVECTCQRGNKDVRTTIARMREMLDRKPPNYCTSILLPAKDAKALLSEIERLRAALHWCLHDSYFLSNPDCFDSNEPKAEGVLETLNAERERIYEGSAEPTK